MTLLASLFRRSAPESALAPLYGAVVQTARAPHWYLDGAVPDTQDGRFDMIAAILSLVLLRLETLGGAEESARLAERFVDDMDGQLRQIGIGDLVVGKHIGRMMSALGGRLAAYRAGLDGSASLEEALERNLYKGETPAAAALGHVAASLRAFHAELADCDLAALRAGRLSAA